MAGEMQDQDRCVSQVGVRLGCVRLIDLDLLEVQGPRYMYMLLRLRFIHIELIINQTRTRNININSSQRVNIYEYSDYTCTYP